jgi:ATP-binding cassette subfamily F protein 3
MSQYDGFILVVSHNRYFLDSFVNKVVEVNDGKIVVYEGNISDYLLKKQAEEAKQEEKPQGKKVAKAGQKSSDPKNQLSRKEKRKQDAKERQEWNKKVGPWKRKAEEAEKKVENLEVLKTDLEARMADPELYQDQEAWLKTSAEYDDCTRRLERWYEKWEAAQESMEKILE